MELNATELGYLYDALVDQLEYGYDDEDYQEKEDLARRMLAEMYPSIAAPRPA